MENSINKKGGITGFIYSCLIFIAVYIFTSLAMIISQFFYLAGGASVLNIILFLSVLSFLILNTVVLFKSKDKNHKMGLLVGYVLAVLIFLMVTSGFGLIFFYI